MVATLVLLGTPEPDSMLHSFLIRSKWSKDKQESPEAMSRYPGKVGETLCVSPRAARLRGGRYHIYNQGGA